MKAALKNKEAFLNLFTKVVDGHQLDKHKKSSLNLFVLKSNANEFIYDEMSRVLENSVIDYAFSRKTRVSTLAEHGEGSLYKDACSLLVPNYGGSGELGEMLLFCFLEADLDAPKILSKLEIKTAAGMHAHGSDGVHFRRVPGEDTYQLIFGESKMEVKIEDGIYNGILSLWEFKNEQHLSGKSKSGIRHEKKLVNSQLDKETFDEEDSEFLKKLIYPSRSPGDVVADDAFALFVGFEIDIDEQEKGLANKEFRASVSQRTEKIVKGQLDYIVKQIKDRELTGHHFYIYFLPFTEIHKKKAEILKKAVQGL